MDIGTKIRELRKINGLTLEELASRSELTKGFLSQVERNLTSPSISTLEDILEALGTNPAEFFQEEKEEQIVFSESDFFVDEKEDYTIAWVIPNAQKNEMEPILLTLSPNGRSFDVANHLGQEFGYILAGSVCLQMENGKNLNLRRGETFYLDGRVSHCLYNPGSKPARILWISTPPIF